MHSSTCVMHLFAKEPLLSRSTKTRHAMSTFKGGFHKEAGSGFSLLLHMVHYDH